MNDGNDGYSSHFNSSVVDQRTATAFAVKMASSPVPVPYTRECQQIPATREIHSDEPIVYIVSIVPGEVLAVKAYKQFDGYRRLVDVPTDLYTVRTTTYGSITAVELVFTKPLSSIKDQGWNDDVYVTFKSDVGPNTVDILKYIIDRWSDLTWDETSFNAVASKLAQFPMNFPILDRKNTLDVLQEIAFQARCALWISNGVLD